MRTAIKLVALMLTAAFLGGCLSLMPALAPKAEDVEPNISSAFPFERRSVAVLDSRMSYVEAGDPEGPVILLLHGNPTSAYLWRNVIPHLEESGRIIAPDLIGMGESGKPDIAYRFADHAAYVSAFIEVMNLRDITLVMHDWGGGVGLDYAARHPENVRALAFMEAVIKPMSLADADMATRYLFGRLRDADDNQAIIVERNYFVERMLPMMSGRALSDEEMAHYRAPFPDEESLRPVAQWPMEIPLDGAPSDNWTRIGDNYAWLRRSETPVLLIHAEPGMIWTDRTLPELRAELPRMETASVGSGLHYLQEVQPTAIGVTLADWIGSLN